MGVQVSFDLPTWQARYPEFSAVSATLATAYFQEATLYHSNDGRGPVNDASQQLLLLNMITAHIAELNRLTTGPDGNAHAVSQLVGRINNASQGTVSVQADFDQPEGLAQFFSQTKYGAAYWTATAGYRTAAYRSGPRRIFDPLYGGRPWYWRV